MSKDRINAILDYWFEGVNDQTPINKKNPPFCKWFVESKAVDEEIRQAFEQDLVLASEGGCKDWEMSNQGRMALILLYDQFSRNIYRGTKQMYAYDGLALELVLRMIQKGEDKGYLLIHRVFLYMPLMHFEDKAIQKMSVEFFTRLVEDAKIQTPDNIHYYEYTLKYAREHCETVMQHDRFPHRDSILQRNF